MKRILVLISTLLFTFNAYAIQLGQGKGEAVPSAADVSGNTAEGRISWDSDDDKLHVGDSAVAVEMSNISDVQVYAYPSADQDNLVDDTWTGVTLNSEVFDDGSDFASNTFTAPVTGVYFISGQVSYEYTDLIADASYSARLNKNSGTIIAYTNAGSAGSNDTHSIKVNALVQLTANDTVTVDARQKTGGNTIDVETAGNNYYTYLTVYRLK